LSLENLLNRLKKGEEGAFKELVFSFSSRLMTVARIYSKNEDDAKDVLQEAYVRVFKKIDTFVGHEEAAFYSWMKRIIINLCLSRNQRKRYKMEQSLETTIVNDSINPQVLGDLNHEQIMKLVFELPEGYRQVFALYAVEGYSHKEIADQLNIGESSSRSQYMRARKLLQKQIHNLYKVMSA